MPFRLDKLIAATLALATFVVLTTTLIMLGSNSAAAAAFLSG